MLALSGLVTSHAQENAAGTGRADVTIAFIERPQRLPEPGQGDSRVMAYTYRLCVTDDPTNRIPFSRPEHYTPSDFEVHPRLAVASKPDAIVRGMFNPACRRCCPAIGTILSTT
jgi:hypothetical protein